MTLLFSLHLSIIFTSNNKWTVIYFFSTENSNYYYFLRNIISFAFKYLHLRQRSSFSWQKTQATKLDIAFSKCKLRESRLLRDDSQVRTVLSFEPPKVNISHSSTWDILEKHPLRSEHSIFRLPQLMVILLRDILPQFILFTITGNWRRFILRT